MKPRKKQGKGIYYERMDKNKNLWSILWYHPTRDKKKGHWTQEQEQEDQQL